MSLKTPLSTAKIRVRGYHLDLYGHVNNARYLEFLEEGRWAAFDDRIDFQSWEDRNLAFFVVNINVNYRTPASLGDVVEVSTILDHFGQRSATLKQEVRKDNGDLAVDALVTFVIVDTKTGRSIPLQGQIREELEEGFCVEEEQVQTARILSRPGPQSL